MAISFVNKSAFASGTAALSVGAVASVVAGDLILLFVESANQPVAAPTGFTQVTNSPVQTGTAAAAGGVALQVFYRFATGADTTTSVADSGDHTTAIKLAYRGVNQTTPFDATPVAGTKATASTTATWPGITTATNNAWVILASGLDLDAASTATTGTPTNANLLNLTERHDQTVTSGVGGGLVIIDGEKDVPGATGTTTATVTSTIQVYLTIALREAPVTGTFAATETGTDTLAATGDVFIKGSGAATETGSDTLSATGTSSGSINGTFAATETGSDTLASTGKVIVRGTFAATETGSDTLAATGKVLVKGTFAATETGADTLAATGKVIVKGTAALTETGADTLAATGKVIVKGTAGLTETGTDVLRAVGGNQPITGSMAAVEQTPDTLAATGKVRVAGAMAATETGIDALLANGNIIVSGAFAATEATADFMAEQYVAPGYISESYVAGGPTGKVLVQGVGAATEVGLDMMLAFGPSTNTGTPTGGGFLMNVGRMMGR